MTPEDIKKRAEEIALSFKNEQKERDHLASFIERLGLFIREEALKEGREKGLEEKTVIFEKYFQKMRKRSIKEYKILKDSICLEISQSKK